MPALDGHHAQRAAASRPRRRARCPRRRRAASRPSSPCEPRDRALGRAAVERQPAGERRVLEQAAEQEVGVGHRRLAARRGRSRPAPGSAPAEAGPTRSAPPASRQAIEPPPAPTVWMSSAGSASGRPAIVALGGLGHLPAVDQADVAGGPAHVEAEHVAARRRARPAAAPRRRRPPGPTAPSARRGRRPRPRSVSPPEDCMICGSGSPSARRVAREPLAGRRRAAARGPRRAPWWRCARTRGRCPRARWRATRGRPGAAPRAARRAAARVRGRRRSAAATTATACGSAPRAAPRAPRARVGSSARSGPSGPHALRRREAQLRAAPAARARRRRAGRGCGRAWRPSSMTSVKPAVAISAVRAARPSSSALVATVMPCAKRSTSLGAGAGPREHQLAPRRSTAERLLGGRRGDLGGVDGGVASTSTASVKVPPTSTPRSMRRRAYARRLRRPPARDPRCRRGAGGRGSSRCGAAACAGRPSPCGWSRGMRRRRR